jgi:hypothetical protein
MESDQNRLKSSKRSRSRPRLPHAAAAIRRHGPTDVVREEMRQGVPASGGGEGRLRRPMWLEEEVAVEGRRGYDVWSIVQLKEAAVELDSKGARPRSSCSATSPRKQAAASHAVWRLEEAAA